MYNNFYTLCGGYFPVHFMCEIFLIVGHFRSAEQITVITVVQDMKCYYFCPLQLHCIFGI